MCYIILHLAHVDYYLHCYASVLQGCSNLQWRLFRSPHNVSVGASVVGCSQASQWDHWVGKRALQEIVARKIRFNLWYFTRTLFDFLPVCCTSLSACLNERSRCYHFLKQKFHKRNWALYCAILSVLMVDLMFKRTASFTLGVPSCSRHGQGIALSGDFAFDPRWCNLQPHNRGFGSLS